MTSSLTDENFVTDMKLKGIGGFGISYSSGLLVLCCLIVCLNATIKKIKLLSALLCILFLYMVLKAQFTTLIIVTLICIGLLLFNNTNRSSIKLLYLILLLVILSGIPAILQYSISFYGDSPIGEHLTDLYNKVMGVLPVEKTQREIYQERCLLLMFDSPIWGNNVNGAYNYLFAHSHSTFLGYGMATGLVGLGFYITTLLKAFKFAISNLGELLMSRFFFPIVLYYLLLSYFNPTNSLEINFTFFLVIPLIYKCILTK